MKITYFGTAASSGFPSVFCNCPYCNAAIRLGGRNLRTRSQALINDDLLVDFPADTYTHFLQNRTEADKIQYLLITHPHHDHLYLADLDTRGGAYAQNMRVPVLRAFCSQKTADTFDHIPNNVELTVLRPFETASIGGYLVTPLPARHMSAGTAFIYIIQGDKTLLYANDTGYFYEEVFAYIEEKRIRFDMVSLDCTYADKVVSDKEGHMGFDNIERLLDRLRAIGAVDAETVKYATHFSHKFNPLQSVLEEKAERYGCLVAYDGCCVEL